MDSDLEPRKMFIGGMSWSTTIQSMTEYFQKFGPVAECTIATTKDLSTGNVIPRGFGFVTFAKDESVEAVLKLSQHTLDNKIIDPKPASNMGSQHNKRVFIGGLSLTTTIDDVKDCFLKENYQVVKVQIKCDNSTGRSRGFGFVDFLTADDVDRAIKKEYIEIDSKMVQVKRAESKFTSDKRSSNGAVMQQSNMVSAYNSSGYHYGNSEGSMNTVSGNNPQYNGNNATYGYPQFGNSSYSEYQGYQHGNSPQVYHYTSGYGNHGYNGQQQQSSNNYGGSGSSYQQHVAQQRNSYSTSRTSSYNMSGATGGGSYEQGYGYYSDSLPTDSTSSNYSRMSGSSGGTPGQTRGGSSGYLPYNNH